jgi:dienelactone hydrolase
LQSIIYSLGGVVYPANFSSLPPEEQSKWSISEFLSRNTKDIRWPEIVAFTKALRAQYKRIGAIGFCYGGWAVFRLGAKGEDKLVDCVSTAHPSLLTKEEIQNVGVPVQILAPENDQAFTPELKAFANEIIPTLGVPYEYSYFPGLNHGFAMKGDRTKELEAKGLERAKNAAVNWFRQWLHGN